MKFRIYDGNSGTHKFCAVIEKEGIFGEEKCIDNLTFEEVNIGLKFLNLVDISVNVESVDESQKKD